MWDSKLGDNIPPDKPLSIHIPDVSKWLSFHPLGKIVRPDKEPPLVPYSSGKWPYYIQTLLSKWPRAGKWIQDSPWLMNIWGISLTLVTLPHIVLRSFLHARPPISLGEGSMGQRPPSCMTPTYPLLQFL